LTNILQNKLLELNRIVKKLIMITVDSVLIILILYCAFALRLDYWYWPENNLIWVIFGAPIIGIPVFYSFKLYKSVIRFIGAKSLISIFQAVTLYSVIWGLLGYMIGIDGIPRSVILINWMLTIIVIGGSRILARWIFTRLDSENLILKKNVIIYGAGSAGRQLSQALLLSGEYKHIAYIDDNLLIDKTYINNIPVFAFSKIQLLINNNDVDEVFLALPSISRRQKKEIIEKLNKFPLLVRSLPSVSALAQGKVKIDDLLEIEDSDLLGRVPVLANELLLKINIFDKVVLVTGAGGSIGSELCRQIISLKPKTLILFELSESSLYQIEQELLQSTDTNVKVLAILGSISDKARLKNIFNRFHVQTIYHAAAYKHVPLVEFNQSEGVLNNTIGTMVVAEAAISANIENFVLISTDKAVRPTNTMGATKRVAELILQALAKQSHNTCFSMVRFGNVLGSSGSVIPTFRKQIKNGGPVTVTDKNIVRYFMSIPEAVELVIQSGAMSKGGEVFVLDMGSPVRIYDLAVKMIKMSGLKVCDEQNPEGDIEIAFTGLRPGEKLYEELLVGDNVSSTQNSLIMSAKEKMIDWDVLKPILNRLQESALSSDQAKIRSLLIEIVPEFKPQSKIRDLLYDE
jgi:FlaA1/EpsC-like NDP-sugar epimerase